MINDVTPRWSRAFANWYPPFVLLMSSYTEQIVGPMLAQCVRELLDAETSCAT